MLNKLTLSLLLLGVLALSAGCANRATASLTAGADLSKTRTFYVVQNSKQIADLVKDNLVKRGFTATVGPELPLPYKADAIVSYEDKWQWDMTMYLLELTITFRNATNNYPMVVGNSYHTSLTRKSPEAMVDEVLTNIFDEAKKGMK